MSWPQLHQPARSPERILINREERQARLAAAEADEYDLDRTQLEDAFHSFARRHGYGDARGWAAAKAFYDPSADARVFGGGRR